MKFWSCTHYQRTRQKISVLATTLFGPKFSFRRHFEQRNRASFSLAPFLYDRPFLTLSFEW